MTRRKISEENIRKITKVGGSSYAVTIPLRMIKDFGWKEKQKVVVKRRGKEIVIKDWQN
jgi:antitoxin component of MazEF toxin-antitoxin module